MAKRRSKNKTNQIKKTRAYSPRIAKRSRLRSTFDPKINTYNNRFIEDRRTYSPNRKLQTITGKTATTTVGTTTNRLKRNNTTPLPYSQKFQNFSKVMVCVRRKQRKEVLHALKKTGTAGQKRPRRTPLSNIHCK